jgi:hypothetical protein
MTITVTGTVHGGPALDDSIPVREAGVELHRISASEAP